MATADRSAVIFVVVLLVSISIYGRIYGENAIGCKFESSICDSAEICVDDAVFGECQTEPFTLRQYDLRESELELLRLELTRLALAGEDWSSDGVQCVLHYFFLAHRFGIVYDQDFCNVRNTADVNRLLQYTEYNLNNAEKNITVDNDNDDNDIDDQQKREAPISDDQSIIDIPVISNEDDNDNDNDNDNDEEQLPSDTRKNGDDLVLEERSFPETNEEDDQYFMSREEEHLLNTFILQMIRGENPDFSTLPSDQLQKFIAYVDLLRAAVNSRMTATTGEVVADDEMQQQAGNEDLQKLLYKKDEEKLGILDQGTGDKEHRIETREPTIFRPTRAPIIAKDDRKKWVEGGRVYIKLNTNITDEDTAKALMAYLEEKVGEPNNVTFSDVRVQDNVVSFKVDNIDQLTPELVQDVFQLPGEPPKLIEAAKVIEESFQLLKKNKLANEAGWGNGEVESSVPLEKDRKDDGFFVATLVVCGLVVGSLVAVLGVYVYRSQTRAKASLRRLAADMEGPPGKDYEELCRQRMSGKTEGPEPLSGIVGTLAQRLGSQSEPSPPPPGYGHSTHSSTSSWNEEPVQTNMDISTGHMILSYMEDHLLNKDRFEQEWKELEAYQPDLTDATKADLKQNAAKNRRQQVVPYDHNRVVLKESGNRIGSDYINASFIYDHDPRNAAYVATQAPLADTVADFWQMVWEQGSVVIVNLTKLTESGEAKCHRYWPENGSQVYHIYEVHLVSEHIWCEDYLVRSFYLKNLRTQETRTVTHFHFLTWPDQGVPASSKSLLEFRRKVNKSYRGRSCPIIVHCSDGGGRTGTYCLLDMVLNRISKGVKEVDIAAALEHLRDQRMSSIGTMEQFEFVLVSVAEEVQAVMKALPQ